VIAIDWGQRVIGSWAVGFAIVVSLSAFGGAVSAGFTYSRILMVVSREGKPNNI